jgi:hypothetical protein
MKIEEMQFHYKMDSLPMEMIQEITFFLKPEDCYRFLRVCKTVNAAMSSDFARKKYLNYYYHKIIKYYDKDCKYILSIETRHVVTKRRCGVYRRYCKNGQLSILSYYKENRLHGLFTHRHASGRIIEESYFRHGMLHGMRKLYDKNGKCDISYWYRGNYVS